MRQLRKYKAHDTFTDEWHDIGWFANDQRAHDVFMEREDADDLALYVLAEPPEDDQ